MNRFPDWPERLHAEIEAAHERPFSWGRHDCALFAADVVRAVTGEDIAAWFRGRYKTRRGAYGALKRFAGGGLEQAMDKQAVARGMAAIRPALAQRGDMVLVDTPEGPALAICVGRFAAQVAESGGVAFADMSLARRAWAVGR